MAHSYWNFELAILGDNIYIYIYILFWGDLKDLCTIFGSFKGQYVILGSLGQKHSFVKFWGWNVIWESFGKNLQFGKFWGQNYNLKGSMYNVWKVQGWNVILGKLWGQIIILKISCDGGLMIDEFCF